MKYTHIYTSIYIHIRAAHVWTWIIPNMSIPWYNSPFAYILVLYMYVFPTVWQTCKPAHTYTFTLCMQESKSMCSQIFKPKKHTHTSQLKALPLYMGLLYVHTREYTQYIHTHTIFCIIYIYIYKHTIYMYIHTHIHDRHCLYGPPVC